MCGWNKVKETTRGHECTCSLSYPPWESVESKVYFNSLPLSPVSLAFSFSVPYAQSSISGSFRVLHTRAETHTQALSKYRNSWLARYGWLLACQLLYHTYTHTHHQAWCFLLFWKEKWGRDRETQIKREREREKSGQRVKWVSQREWVRGLWRSLVTVRFIWHNN